MNHLDDALEALGDTIAETLADVYAGEAIFAADDNTVLRALAIAARLQRCLDGLLVELVGDIDARATAQPHDNGIVARSGYRSLNDLLQQVALTTPQAIGGLMRVARAVRRPVGLCTGEFLLPELPALRDALLEGAVGVEGVAAVLGPLRDLHLAVGAARMRDADAVLASAVRGTLAEVGGDADDPGDGAAHGALPPMGGRELRNLARDLAFRLDPDGAEPADERAARKRGVSFGVPHDGLVPLRGNLLPDVAGQLQRIFDSLLTPKLTGPRFITDAEADAQSTTADAGRRADEHRADERSQTQKQHDALATALTVAARAGELPTIGGSAPTLVISVRAEDLAAGTGFAVIDGTDQPTSIGVARQTLCGGSIQRVLHDDTGRIVQLGVTDRVFNQYQRKAIVLRDGGCVIPGCTVPASWCEIHHDIAHARGGPTHTDNGVLLCWWHHRSLGTRDGWQVRMRDGTPEVRGPTWWDIYRTWRPTTKSRLQQHLRATGP